MGRRLRSSRLKSAHHAHVQEKLDPLDKAIARIKELNSLFPHRKPEDEM